MYEVTIITGAKTPGGAPGDVTIPFTNYNEASAIVRVLVDKGKLVEIKHIPNLKVNRAGGTGDGRK